MYAFSAILGGLLVISGALIQPCEAVTHGHHNAANKNPRTDHQGALAIIANNMARTDLHSAGKLSLASKTMSKEVGLGELKDYRHLGRADKPEMKPDVCQPYKEAPKRLNGVQELHMGFTAFSLCKLDMNELTNLETATIVTNIDIGLHGQSLIQSLFNIWKKLAILPKIRRILIKDGINSMDLASAVLASDRLDPKFKKEVLLKILPSRLNDLRHRCGNCKFSLFPRKNR